MDFESAWHRCEKPMSSQLIISFFSFLFFFLAPFSNNSPEQPKRCSTYLRNILPFWPTLPTVK